MKNIVKNTLLVFAGFVLSMTLITVFAEDVKTSVTKILNETGIITTETFITHDEAIAIAKAQASEDTIVVEVKLDVDDKEYEIKLTSDMYKYEIEIHAVSGLVKDVEKELIYNDSPTAQLLSLEEVIAIARTIVGDARLVEFELEDDDHPPYYELEFKGNGREYELKIDAVTGAILQSKVEYDDDDDDDEYQGTRITEAEARRIALSFANGNIMKMEQGDDEFKYEIYFGGKEYKIEIDAYTGELVKLEMDDDDDDDDDDDSDDDYDDDDDDDDEEDGD